MTEIDYLGLICDKQNFNSILDLTWRELRELSLSYFGLEN